MSYTKAMLDTHPRQVAVDPGLLAEAIDEVSACAQACTACADACLGEDDATALTRCIRLNLDCADQCMTTLRVLSRQTDADPTVTVATLRACADMCRACADECEHHAEHHEHCRVCGEACRRCADVCTRLADAVAA